MCVCFLKGVFQEISDALSWGPHRQDPAIIISGQDKLRLLRCWRVPDGL